MMNVYILHGWVQDQNSEERWAPLIRAFEGKGIRVKFLKIPGLLSPLEKVWNLQDYVGWLNDQIIEKQAIIIGHSFGGQIAIRFSSLYPERVAKLILIDNSGIRDRAISKRLKRGFFWLVAKVGKPFSKINSIKRLFYRSIRATDYMEASPLLRETMKNVLKDEVREDLVKIKTPTLIIWGDKDGATPIKHGRLEASKIKNAELKVIQGARHAPQFTHTEEVFKLITSFLK